MGRFDGVLLASDFDNTLIYTEDALLRGEPIPPLPERNRQALTYFMAEGGRFAISTGRALAAFEKYAPLVPMNAPGVICNGAALYDFAKQEYLVSALLDEALPDYQVVNMGVFAYTNATPQLLLILDCMQAGDILLDSPEFDAAQRQFNRDQFYVTEDGYTVFYQQHSLGYEIHCYEIPWSQLADILA